MSIFHKGSLNNSMFKILKKIKSIKIGAYIIKYEDYGFSIYKGRKYECGCFDFENAMSTVEALLNEK